MKQTWDNNIKTCAISRALTRCNLNPTFFKTKLKTSHFIVLNLTEKSYKSACQEHEDSDHWYFGSIAQVTIAAVDFTLVDGSPHLSDGLAKLVVASRFKTTQFLKSFNGYVSNFSVQIDFIAGIEPARTGHLFLVRSTVIPTLCGCTLVAREPISFKTKQNSATSKLWQGVSCMTETQRVLMSFVIYKSSFKRHYYVLVWANIVRR